MKLFLANIPSTVCIIGSIILAYKGLEGWGWLIFAACILSCSYEVRK